MFPRFFLPSSESGKNEQLPAFGPGALEIGSATASELGEWLEGERPAEEESPTSDACVSSLAE